MQKHKQAKTEFAAQYRAFIKEHTVLAAPPLVPEIKLHLASEITPLWRATEASLAQEDMPPPFWSFAWPGGQALARFIMDHPQWIKDRRVFDFASGSGLVAFAAKMAGAKTVTANDVDPLAILAITLNAEANALEINTAQEDYVGKNMDEFDVILAGDFCYEWPMAGYAVEWLRLCVAEGKTVLIADPGRTYLPQEGIKALAHVDVPVSREVEDSAIKHTTIYQLLMLDEA